MPFLTKSFQLFDGQTPQFPVRCLVVDRFFRFVVTRRQINNSNFA